MQGAEYADLDNIMEKKVYELQIGGQTMSAEFNDWADQANGSVLLRYGNSAVLATAVMGSKESTLDYFPLSVEYEEKFYAAGAILGSRFMRREGRPCGYPNRARRRTRFPRCTARRCL